MNLLPAVRGKVGGLLDRLSAAVSPLSTNGRGAKLRRMVHAPATTWQFWPLSDVVNEDRIDYASVVGDGLDSSVISAALCWIMRTFPEAPAVLQRLEEERQWRTVHRRTDYGQLLARPNPFYDGRILWMATCMDFAFGEAYWLKLRNVLGQPVELWWVPRRLMTPRAPLDGSLFISHYDYHVAGQTIPLEPRDVVHFRFGMDPRNLKRGFSQLAAVLREVYTDDQACDFTAAILRNLGIIGVVVSPKEKERYDKEAVTEVREYLKENFTRGRRGGALALGSPTDVQVLQYNLQGFDIGPIRDIAEERVTAALGIPAAVVGFGTGLQQTKVGATMRELIQLAWKGCLMPMQKILAGELDRSLLPDFFTDTAHVRTAFDTTEVRALWEDETQRGDRVSKLFTSGVLKRGEARREIGYATEEKDDIFVLPVNLAPAGDGVSPPVPIEPEDDEEEEEEP